MKLERTLKTYFKKNLQEIDIPLITGITFKENEKKAKIDAKASFIINTAINLLILVMLIFGLLEYKENSKLSVGFINIIENKNNSGELQVLRERKKFFLKLIFNKGGIYEKKLCD